MAVITVDQIKALNLGYLTGADLLKYCAAAYLIKQMNVDADCLQEGANTAYGEVRNKLSTRYDITDELKNNGVINASALATIAAGIVNALSLTNPGIGYIASPTVTIIDIAGPGAGATATAALVPTVLKNIAIVSGGINYMNPIVSIIGGLGDGGIAATALAIIRRGAIVGFTITSPGAGYISTPAVIITDANGSGATASASLVETVISSLALTAGGTGYVNPQVIITGGLGFDSRETVLVKIIAIWAIRNALGNFEHLSDDMKAHYAWADQEVYDIRNAQANLELDAAAKCEASTAGLVRGRFSFLG